jgi:hypothetical protein
MVLSILKDVGLTIDKTNKKNNYETTIFLLL